MTAHRILSVAIALGVAAGVTSCTAPPTASPEPTPSASSAPVTVEEISEGDQAEGVDVEVDGPTQVNYRKITLEPGAGTGLHCHYGQLIAIVDEGVFTHYAPVYPDGVKVYTAGESIIEGAEYVHEGVNEGTEDVVLWVTYVTPEGKPLAETELENCESQGDQ